MKTNLRIEEFISFILLYAAKVDNEFSDKEKDYIQSLVKKTDFEKAQNLFNNLNTTERQEVLLQHIIKHKEDAKLNNIEKHLLTLIEFDGINRFESSFLQHVNDLIEAVKD